MNMDSGFTSFFQQLPAFIYLMFCGSAIALVVVIGVIFNQRNKRVRAALAGVPAATSNDVTALAPTNVVYATNEEGETIMTDNFDDLPDLDALLSSVPKAAPPRSGTYSVTLAEGGTIEAAEVMTVLRDVTDGGLLVQIGGKVYRVPPAVADAEVKRRYNTTVRELYAAISDTALASPRSTGQIASAVPSVDDESEIGSIPLPPKRASGEMPPLPPRDTTPITAPLPGDLPKFKMPDVIEPPRRGRRRPPAEPIPEINIVEAIEAFLQYKLKNAPEWSSRNMHIKPALGGGLRIDVDGQYYESVDEIDDPAARAFIQATIEEWQERQ